ncbi:MAG TPA: 2-oxoglutarate dehydrogenase, E2 component, dihydrolipoamide succinyltransferase [Acidobacteriaceae bacterium]
MATEVIMPQMGESIFEGTITKWLKKPGQAVAKDEPLFEISTDKVDAEIPSPAPGILTEVLFAEGDTVQVNTVVARIGESGELQAAATPSPSAITPGAPGLASETRASHQPPSSPSPSMPAPTATAIPAGATEVVMPQMGESIFEGTITKWLKHPGDAVSKDEPLFEISTDKVDAEIPAPATGILSEIRHHEGETVAVNTVVAIIRRADEEQPIADAGAPSLPLGHRQAAERLGWEPQTLASQPTPLSTGQQAETALTPAPTALTLSTETPRSSPLVRRIARENNLDLRQITGTGSNGRITKQDALSYLANRGAIASPTSQPAAATSTPSTPSPLLGQLVPLSRMRSIIAQRMVDSRRISPHVHTVFKIDMTRIARLREREKSRFEAQHGVKLTYMPFIAAAVIQALGKFPVVNASLETTPSGDAIRYHQNINLGIAVALEWGLIVPVIHQAESKSFPALAASVADLALRARTKRLNPEEVQGSTFTLTNSGIFGEEFGFPIINQPNSAILAIGALKKEPVVLTDAEGNDAIAIRSMQHFCLGFDHRTIDGADAGKFMAEFKSTLENWPATLS